MDNSWSSTRKDTTTTTRVCLECAPILAFSRLMLTVALLVSCPWRSIRTSREQITWSKLMSHQTGIVANSNSRSGVQIHLGLDNTLRLSNDFSSECDIKAIIVFCSSRFKPSTTETLCEDISRLFFRGNEINSHSPFFNCLFNPKICHLDMFCPGNGCQIFGYVYSSVTVTKEW